MEQEVEYITEMVKTSDENVNVYFVVPKEHKSEDDASEDMWKAYEKCENVLNPMWINERECNRMKPVKNDVFVMPEFEGELFEKLKKFKCQIIGPRCLLYCFVNDEPIPDGLSPVYTVAMKGLCICPSGLTTQERDHIEKLVGYMGGIFTKELRNPATHLVTASVFSAKYETALGMKIRIMKKEWVEAVWEKNLTDFVEADDSTFDKYKASVFLNLVVTSTNLRTREKEEIKRLIDSHGGTFMGPLDGSKVQVVLAPKNSPLSDKLRFAKRTNIACLTPEWVYESIKVGYALPFKDFVIKSAKACSTPEKSNVHETLNCSSISTIPSDLPQTAWVNESSASAVSNVSTIESVVNNISTAPVVTILDKLTFSEAKSAGSFLDGCCIYLAGFAPNQRDKLNRILNLGSATRLDDISDAVTHVIVGDENRASQELKLLNAKGLCPYILTLEWLQASMILKKHAPEENFLFDLKTDVSRKQPVEPPSPLSKKSLQMLQKPKRPPIPPFNIDQKMSETVKQDESYLVEQFYLQDAPAADSTIEGFLRAHSPRKVEEPKKSLVTDHSTARSKDFKESAASETVKKMIRDSTEMTINQTSILNDKLFEGLTFVLSGFSNDDGYLPDTINAMGGKVDSSPDGIPDFGIVPKCGAPLKHTVNEIVTELYIEDCLNQDQIVDIQYYHRPLYIKKHSNPLSSCVITMSMYTGVERTYLTTLATELGAKCQDIFVRKTNIEKNTYGSTHLVCPTPEGNKYNAAVKWKLPAVTGEWLKACAAQSSLANETPFLVGETTAPERSMLAAANTPALNLNASQSNCGTESTQKTPQTVTPKYQSRLLSQDQSPMGTPLINKRLSMIMNQSPPSPFHVSTPDSPYGQVFKPNPSPATRKFWKRWIDGMPDLRDKETPIKRRKPSTPLSDLLRQLWEWSVLPTGSEDNRTDVAGSAAGSLGNVGIIQQSSKGSLTTTTTTTTTATPAADAIATTTATPLSTHTSISKRLEFADENVPADSDEISLQIAKLDQALQQTSRNSKPRSSHSRDSGRYYVEPLDHVQKCMLRETPPGDTVVWEDPSDPKRMSSLEENESSSDNEQGAIENVAEEVLQENHEHPKIRKFMLSGIRDKMTYEQTIRDLGAEVTVDTNFDVSATHLLCIRPARNEKMLGSIASGKWVLHVLYLRDSEQQGHFLDEEKYEWGNPKSKGIIPDPNGEVEETIAAAAYKWRLRLLVEPSGPFNDIVALLLVSGEKYEQFKRLIEAGKGKVVQARPPYDTSPSGKKITHCFVNVKQASQPIDWAMLASKGILCFVPQYLSDYLTTKSPLNPRECVIPEFKKYLTLLPK